MSGTTPRLGLPYPTSTDLVSNGPSTIQSLANVLDASALYNQGTYAARPVTVPAAGNLYYATDTGQMFVSTGTAWVTVDPVDAVAATASMRTLGTGANQAAAGSHAAQHASSGADKLYTTGTVTIPAPPSTITVTHGLGFSPSAVILTGFGSPSATAYVADQLTSTTFRAALGGGSTQPAPAFWVALR